MPPPSLLHSEVSPSAVLFDGGKRLIGFLAGSALPAGTLLRQPTPLALRVLAFTVVQAHVTLETLQESENKEAGVHEVQC